MPLLPLLDYLKIGHYDEKLGGLDSGTTNQRFYRVENGQLIDETEQFQRRKNSISGTVNVPERTEEMAHIKQRITLPNGKTVWCTGENLGEAISNLLSRLSVAEPEQKQQAPTLKEYGEKWFSMYHVEKVKWNTAQNTRTYLDKHIFPILGQKRLNEITFDDIQSVFNREIPLYVQRFFVR